MPVDLMNLAEGTEPLENSLSRGLSDLRGKPLNKDLMTKFNQQSTSYESIPKPVASREPSRKWTPPTSPTAQATGGGSGTPKLGSPPGLKLIPVPDVVSSVGKEEPMSPTSPLSANVFLQRDKSFNATANPSATARKEAKAKVEEEKAKEDDDDPQSIADRVQAARNSFAQRESSSNASDGSLAKASSCSSAQPADLEDAQGAAERRRAARNSFAEREKAVEEEKAEIEREKAWWAERKAATEASYGMVGEAPSAPEGISVTIEAAEKAEVAAMTKAASTVTPAAKAAEAPVRKQDHAPASPDPSPPAAPPMSTGGCCVIA